MNGAFGVANSNESEWCDTGVGIGGADTFFWWGVTGGFALGGAGCRCGAGFEGEDRSGGSCAFDDAAAAARSSSRVQGRGVFCLPCRRLRNEDEARETASELR